MRIVMFTMKVGSLVVLERNWFSVIVITRIMIKLSVYYVIRFNGLRCIVIYLGTIVKMLIIFESTGQTMPIWGPWMTWIGRPKRMQYLCAALPNFSITVPATVDRNLIKSFFLIV